MAGMSLQMPDSSFGGPRVIKLALLFLFAGLMVWRLLVDRSPGVPAPRQETIETTHILHTYPHDAEVYTQGLYFDDGGFVESTGLYGQSSIRKIALNGRIRKSFSLGREYFGEGATQWGDRIFQLTWKARTGFVYDAETLKLVGRFSLPSEGWGLTTTDTHLVMSDGSDILYFLDPSTQAVVRKLKVQERGQGVGQLNELEYVKGQVLANVYGSNYIVRIDPDTGAVLGWIDLTPVIPGDHKGLGVPNGIAYDRKNDRLFITGKKWPVVYEIGLARASPGALNEQLRHQ